MPQLEMEVGQSGLHGLTVRELANPHLETSLENTGQELVLILHLPTEVKTAKASKRTWNCVIRIKFVVSYDLIAIQSTH